MSPRRARRGAAALVAGGLLAAAFLLPARQPLGFDVCLLQRLTGVPCLACGLTRSVCLFAQGEWGASLRMHPAGWLAFGALAVVCSWLAGEAAANRDLGAGARTRLLGQALWLGGALSLLGWGARLAGVWPAL